MRAGLSGRGQAVNVLDLGRTAAKRRGMTDATPTLTPKPWISGIAPYVPGKSAGADGRRTIGGRQEGFSWSEVKSVQQTGGDVHLMFAGNQHLATIYLRSEDLAKRVAYAIEFLRMQCDAAAGTGF